ncbi:MAG: M28 family peptidase [Candidatus Omnitrophica bacterium]|nr:M28 family peptidase [Candidatus Omnitrophota bacterium]
MEIPRVEPESLDRFLRAVCCRRSPLADPEGIRKVSDFVKQSLSGFGYEVEEDPFLFEGDRFWNLIAKKREEAGVPLLVGAHFDAVDGTVGADDNASGLAVMLELARLMSGHPAGRRVRFAAFNLEEWGMVGSSHYAGRLKREGAALRGMISLEMLGFTGAKQSYPKGLSYFYPAKGDFIGVGANWRSRRFLKSFVRGMRRVNGLRIETITLPGRGGLVEGLRASDHAPFWDAGYPALLITDTAYFRNPYYHTPQDTLETLDLPFLRKVAQGVLEGILETVK